MADRPPSEIARETLKQLATRRLPPTPDNYLALYDEIAGTRSPQPFPDGQLHHILRVLPGQTPAQKRLLGQFERAVNNKDWTSLQSVLVGYANLGLSPAAAAPVETAASTTAPGNPGVLPDEFAQMLARLIDNTLPALGEDDARVIEMAQKLIAFLKEPAPPISTVQLMLGNFTYRLSFATEDQAAIRSSLLELLHMVFENIAVLSVEDRWLHGQAEALMAASTPPLTLRRLDDVQRRLKDVIFKQTEAKARTVEAQEQMKDMLATFIERLAKITASSTTYQGTMARCADLIGKANTLEEIAPVLQEVMTATRSMALDSRVAHDELHDLRERTEAKRAEVAKLQEELDRASAQARHDPLTGSLNRKGLDEAMEREIARSRRLAVAPELSPQEAANLPPTVQPLVRIHPRSGRKALYLGSHAERIVGWPHDEGRALLDELENHATRAEFVYSHAWQDGDLVMWDNRCTLHRATPFRDDLYVRDMRRTTVADA